jgi:hypothetical protein
VPVHRPEERPAGIAANLLSARLKELEDAGLISRENAPPPVATVLYALTRNGHALEPVLKALGLWGLRYMTGERPADSFQSRWLAYAPAWFTTDTDPHGPPAVIQLVAAGEEAVIELGNGQVRTRIGRANDPDLLLDGPPRALLGLVTGLIDIELATAIGLTVRGDRELLGRLRPLPVP